MNAKKLAMLIAWALTFSLTLSSVVFADSERQSSGRSMDAAASTLDGDDDGNVTEDDNDDGNVTEDGDGDENVTEKVKKKKEEKREKKEKKHGLENALEHANEHALKALTKALEKVREHVYGDDENDDDDDVTIDVPADGSVTADPNFSVNGTAKAGYTVKVEIKNRAGETKLTQEVPVDAQGQFDLSQLPLLPGLNKIEIKIKDASGKEVAEIKKRVVVPGDPTAMPQLSDVQGHWAEANIARLAALDIINGYQDGTFQPGKAMTGAEFVKVLTQAANLDVTQTQPQGFSQLPADFWARPYISAAQQKSIVKGDDDDAFQPTEAATRAQMAVMLIRALGLEQQAAAKAQELAQAQNAPFADAASIPAWARGHVALAAEKGLITGFEDKTFRPNERADRAQAATLILRFMKLLERR